MATFDVGQQAEQQAAQFLQSQGLKLIAKNYRSPLGEIDLIMADNHEIVFIEVRKRSKNNYNNAMESVTSLKQRRIIKTAIHFLQKKGWLDRVECRFDIIGFTDDKVEWLKDAFVDELK